MKRHPTLKPLSREHHLFLMLCRDARWLAAGDPRAPTEAVFIEGVEGILPLLWRHFEQEEGQLWPACRAWLDESISFDRLQAEHDEIRRQLPTALAARDVAGMVVLLELLHDHIRTEERVLFEVIQARVPAGVLNSFSFG